MSAIRKTIDTYCETEQTLNLILKKAKMGCLHFKYTKALVSLNLSKNLYLYLFQEQWL